MSGAQPSGFANQLFDPMMAIHQQEGQNQLLQQQQDIGGHEIEMASRLANTVLDQNRYPTPEARAAAYPTLLANARASAPGYFKNAPATYPGDDVAHALASWGTPSQTLSERQANIAANQAIANAGNTPAAPAAGGGAAAPVAPATSATVEPDALARAQQVRDGLIKRGLDTDTATAFAANALHESSANPNTGAGDAGASHGLFQWRDDRYNRYQSIFGNTPDKAPLEQQLDYVVHELNTTEGAARDRIAAAQGPAAKAAAISQYYLRPKDVQAEMARRSGTAAQLVSQWGNAGTSSPQAPVIAGDSLASSGGLGGSGVVGAGSKAVLAAVQADSRAGKYSGQPVVLSTGASNDGSTPDFASIEQQIRETQAGNAGRITVLGVGPAVEAKAPGTNAKLEALAKSYGADFVPLPANMMSPDGVHPTAQGYAALKAAVAPPAAAPGAPATPAPYRVAGAMQPPPGTAAAPGQAAPASGQPAAPGGAASAQPPAPAAPAGAPPPPHMEPLLPNGVTARQQAILDAQGRTGQMTGKERLALEQQYANQNIQTQQKQFSDWIQTQQLATSQGQLTVAQQNSALEYWKAAHPNAKITMTGGEIITQNERTGEEIAPRIQVTPQRADTAAMAIVSRLGPKVANGTATPEEQSQYAVAVDSYRQPQLRENPVTKETLRVNTRELPAGFPEPPSLGSGAPGTTGTGGGSQVVIPGYSPAQQEIERDPAKAKVADEQYGRDSKKIGDLTEGVTAAQNDNLRTKEMLDLLNNGDFSTGPGSETRTRAAAWFQRWAPAALTGWQKESENLTGAAAAQAFQKLAFQGVTTQEKESSPRGGILATQLFQKNNPGLDLLNPTNKSLLDMKLIQNQANIDYGRDALGHFATQETRYGDTHKYSSQEQFNTQWINQRNPQVYAAAMGAVSGQPPEQWAKGLSDAEYARALGIVERAKPGAVVNGKSGRIVVQPPAAPPPPPGFTVQ